MIKLEVAEIERDLIQKEIFELKNQISSLRKSSNQNSLKYNQSTYSHKSTGNKPISESPQPSIKSFIKPTNDSSHMTSKRSIVPYSSSSKSSANETKESSDKEFFCFKNSRNLT